MTGIAHNPASGFAALPEADAIKCSLTSARVSRDLRSPKGRMKILAKHSGGQLEMVNHCADYEGELNRVWPRNGKRREALVEQTA